MKNSNINTEMEIIHQSMINGQRRQAVSQINEAGMTAFFLEYPRYLEEMVSDPEQRFDDLKDVIRAYVIWSDDADPKRETWMTVCDGVHNWDALPQIRLGNIPWSSAVAVAKAQGRQVRLCHSPGYDNQGHYISPNH